MDKLQKILQGNKPTAKVTINKQVIAQQQALSDQQNQLDKKQQEELHAKKLQRLQEFYDYDTRRKIVKLNQVLDDLPLTVEEVKTKLRNMHQPITLFGESEVARYRRFKKIEEFHIKNPHYDMKIYDQDFQLKLKQKEELIELDNKYRHRMIQPQLGDDLAYIRLKKAMIEGEKQPIAFENVCDQVYLWLHKIMRDWAQALEQKYHGDAKGAAGYQRYHDTNQDIHSLLQVLKKRGGDQQMITSIYKIMNCCLVREYKRANDGYINLSIGTAPWPMGVAMLGITVRRNSQRLSHVLTEELSRKWMQSLKRIITVSQQLYPSTDQNEVVSYSVNSAL